MQPVSGSRCTRKHLCSMNLDADEPLAATCGSRGHLGSSFCAHTTWRGKDLKQQYKCRSPMQQANSGMHQHTVMFNLLPGWKL
eukprot:1760537-Amphidinium_carterae.2